MGTGRRLLGGSASLAVNMLLLTLLMEAAPGHFCESNCIHATYLSLNNGIGYPSDTDLRGHVRAGFPKRRTPTDWMPFIDTPDGTYSDHGFASDNAPSCHVKIHDPTLRLIDAPLPEGLPIIIASLSTAKDVRVFLCVQVDTSGHVRRAYLPRSTGDTVRDQHLLHLVATQWRFEKSQAITPGWVRMRLDRTDVDIDTDMFMLK